MSQGDIGRRRFLNLSASGAGALWLTAATPGILASLATGCAPDKPTAGLRTFTPEQAADIDAITSLIIPSDDKSPGAREARVTQFIDRSLATFAREQRPLFERSLAALCHRAAAVSPGAKSFAALSEAHQASLLRALETEHSEFFDAIRTATVVGMLANPEYGGNFEKSGWKLIGFQDRFAWQAPFGDYDREVPNNV